MISSVAWQVNTAKISCICAGVIYNGCMDELKKHKKSLAVCMIVKNESRNIAKTLKNNVRFSDCTIVVDTGSSDGTAKAAEEMGARVYHHKWRDDFSEARNFSISKAKEDWILWLDADEFIDEASFGAIRRFLDDTDADVVVLPIYECPFEQTTGESFYLRDKIFRNGLGMHFVKPVNEQLTLPGGKKRSVKEVPGARICHWGLNLPPEQMKAKMAPRLELLKKTAEASSQDYAVRYLLGLRYFDMKQAGDAMEYFSQVVSICEKEAASDDQKKYFSHAARAKRAELLLESGRAEEALAEALAGVQMAPVYLEPCDTAVIALLRLGRFDAALELTEQMLKLPRLRHPVLLYNEEKYGSLVFVLHIRALLKAKGTAAAISFAEEALRQDPGRVGVKEALEIIKGLQ